MYSRVGRRVGRSGHLLLALRVGSGVDIAPGVYRTIAPVGGRCYWATLKTGSNGEIIANAIVEGGRPQVTLKVGQDFETTRCGDWAKIG